MAAAHIMLIRELLNRRLDECLLTIWPISCDRTAAISSSVGIYSDQIYWKRVCMYNHIII